MLAVAGVVELLELDSSAERESTKLPVALKLARSEETAASSCIVELVTMGAQVPAPCWEVSSCPCSGGCREQKEGSVAPHVEGV